MQFKITAEPEFLRVTLSGRLTKEDVLILGQAVHEIEQASPRIPNRLTDVSRVDVSDITGADVQGFARNRREMRYRNPFFNAIYAPLPVQYGYGRMFQTFLDHPDITTRIFTDEAAAVAWLKENATKP